MALLFYIQNRRTHGVKITPQMDIESVFAIRGIDGLAIADDTRHNTEYHFVRNAILAPDVVVTADHIVIRANFEDAVEYMFIADLVEHYIILFRAARKSTDFDDVSALAEEWHHAGTNVSIDQVSVLL